MSEFRKILLACAAVALLTGIANAVTGPPITASTTAQPLTVRAEGTIVEMASIDVPELAGSGQCEAVFRTPTQFTLEKNILTPQLAQRLGITESAELSTRVDLGGTINWLDNPVLPEDYMYLYAVQLIEGAAEDAFFSRQFAGKSARCQQQAVSVSAIHSADMTVYGEPPPAMQDRTRRC